MRPSKNARYLLVVVLPLLIFYSARAQNMDDTAYKHKMQLIDSLSFYNMKGQDTLWHISSSKDFGGSSYKEDYYGWITRRNEGNLLFLNINGKQTQIDKKEITGMKPLPLNQETIDSLISRDNKHLVNDWGNFAGNDELALWLHLQGKDDYAKAILPKNKVFFADTDLRNGFGWQYYDAMLRAYSYDRDYGTAMAFGAHLSGDVFKGFEYQKEAIELTQQLKDEPEDFKTFRLPDSLEWSALKQKLTRKEQLLYLADRLRLLNCIQPGQPAGIDYGMYQYAIPFAVHVL
jgi:hypothetical protein